MIAHNKFTLCNLIGLIMLGGAGLFITFPPSIVVSTWLLFTFAVLFGLFGSILIYYQRVGHLRFFLLTAPFLIIASIYLTFGFLNNRSALIPGYFILAFDVTLQYCHARQEEWRKWTNL